MEPIWSQREIGVENKIKKLRNSTNKSQREFASTYNIPLSTLKKWEQNESAPAPYVLSLLSTTIDKNKSLIEISDINHAYYFDEITKTVYNKKGDCIQIGFDIMKIKKGNLLLYLEDLFEGYRNIKNEFVIKCDFDRKEKIEWRRVR